MTWALNTCADTKIFEKLPPDSAEQQALITAIQDNDGYNWGYAFDFFLDKTIRFKCFAFYKFHQFSSPL